MKKRLTGKERALKMKYAFGSGDPIVKPGETSKNATVNLNSRRLKTNQIDQDALLADRIGELIAQDYDPFSSKGRLILDDVSNNFYNPQFASDLGTRITALRTDPFYNKLTPQQKVTHFFGTGKGKSELDQYLNRAKSIGGSPAAYLTGNPTYRMATGGEAGMSGGGAYGMMAQLLPQIGNAIMTLTDKPSYTNQPIMNAQTSKNMTSPYAFGGELDDIDDEQFKLYLQAMFMNQLNAENNDEDDYDTLTEGIDEESATDEESFAMGGKTIHINPKNKGKFNALKKRTGKTTEQLTHSKNPLTRKRAIFAQNAAKWKHAMGGSTDIEVEGDEIVQTPDGQMQKMQGPSHEQGGIDMNVPEGTKIYSDRLELEGKTMQQRKLTRERRLAKATKMFKSNPSDAIARNTFERTKEIVTREEEQDMALQKIANKIYNKPQKRQAAYGDEIGNPTDPWNDYMSSTFGFGHQDTVPFFTGDNSAIVQGRQLGNSVETSNNIGANINIPVVAQTGAGFGPTSDQIANANSVNNSTGYGNVAGLTTGDYIGLGANLFNAIAPIINTKKAAKATKPEVNRFQSFGKQAMEANAKAQSFAGIQAANAKRELDTAAGSAILRNRLGARSINTMRALDTVTDINRNKAIGDVNAMYTNQLTNLLGQEAQLANQRDQVVMSGATARDQREAQNIDNYYSNMAENLTNFGSNIGNIGRSLNQSKANKDNTALLEAMSEYFDFGRKDGKLVLKNKGR